MLVCLDDDVVSHFREKLSSGCTKDREKAVVATYHVSTPTRTSTELLVGLVLASLENMSSSLSATSF